jgi:hypothetical protein
MMCIPSWVWDASTTLGDEYALDVTHVQCTTKYTSSPSVFRITAPRVSSPIIPRHVGLDFLLPEDPGVIASARSSATDALGRAVAVDLSFFAASTLSPSNVSGTVGSIYVSKMLESATAAETHTIGVSVSISRTITPAK